MFLTKRFHLVVCSLCWLIQVNQRLVETLNVRNSQTSAFKVVELHSPEWYGDNSREDSTDESVSEEENVYSIVPNFESNFTSMKNEYRSESYAKALLAGLKDNRQQHKKQIQLALENNLTSSTSNYGLGKSSPSKKIVCYYNVPTMYDVPYGVFPEQIPPELCTHIIIGFARVFNYTLVPNDERDLEFYNRTIKLKKSSPNLKVMLGVASTNDGSRASSYFVSMMKTRGTRQRFINQSIAFLSAYKFDGVEFDWEFPAFDGPREQKKQLTSLLTEFKRSSSKLNPDLILSVAVPAIKLVIDLGFDIPGIARVVDFVDLMCYDYHHYSWLTPVTGPNSPLYNEPSELGFFKTLNMEFSTKYWYTNGMPAEKIVVGMPTYGHSYKLADSRYHSYYAIAEGFGSLGSNGFVSYVPICNFLQQNGTRIGYGNGTHEPYAFRGRDWVAFDNEQSAADKGDYVRSMGFGGMMFYSLNSDDAWKLCRKSTRVFPIIQSAKDHLLGIHR